jgi:hypothetical protein
MLSSLIKRKRMNASRFLNRGLIERGTKVCTKRMSYDKPINFKNKNKKKREKENKNKP